MVHCRFVCHVFYLYIFWQIKIQIQLGPLQLCLFWWDLFTIFFDEICPLFLSILTNKNPNTTLMRSVHCSFVCSALMRSVHQMSLGHHFTPVDRAYKAKDKKNILETEQEHILWMYFDVCIKVFRLAKLLFVQAGFGQKKGGSYVNQPILQIFHLSQGLAGQKRDNCRARKMGAKKLLDDRPPPPTHSVSGHSPPGRGSDKKSLICKTALVLLPEAVAALTRGAPSNM